MIEVRESRATLRFFGEDLDPNEITRLPGKKPTIAERRGEVLRNPKGGGERVLARGSWRLRATDISPANLDRQIDELLHGATTDCSAWQDLSRRCEADVFCGSFLKEGSGEIPISPETSRRIGERGPTIVLDVWSGDTYE